MGVSAELIPGLLSHGGWVEGGGQELLLSGLNEELQPALPAGTQGGCVLRSTLRSQGLSSVTI